MTRTVLLSIAALCVVALVNPLAANFLRAEAPFSVTDPAALILLLAACAALAIIHFRK